MRGNLKLDESCILNPRSEICNWTSNPKFRISDWRWSFVRFHNFPHRIGIFTTSGLDFGRWIFMSPSFNSALACV